MMRKGLDVFRLLQLEVSYGITMCATNLLRDIALDICLKTYCVRQMEIEVLCWTFVLGIVFDILSLEVLY